MRISILTTCLIYMLNSLNASEEITPYKFENLNDIKTYKIPENSRFTVKRQIQNASNILCYLSTP